ncbi:MAG: tetratricopeptide repeat protein [Pseudomonadota bacterium]
MAGMFELVAVKALKMKQGEPSSKKVLAKTRGLSRGNALATLSAALFLTGISTAQAETNAAVSFEPSNSLAGNYLAARVATTDKNTQWAVSFYRKAIALDPDNQALKLKGFLNFIANGDFQEGVDLGKALIQAERAPEVVHIVMAVDHLRSRSWSSTQKELDRNWRSALDRLIAGLVSAWGHFGAGDVAKGLEVVDALEGPEWFSPFKQYHGGLLSLANGNQVDAIRRLQAAYDNPITAQAAPNTFNSVTIALVQAYLQNKQADRAKAIVTEALRRRPQNEVYLRLQNAAAEGAPSTDPDMTIATATRGAAEVFFNIGKALDRENGQQFARIYMQLAQTLAPKSEIILLELASQFDKNTMLVRANDLFGRIPEGSAHRRIAQLEKALNLDELGDLKKARGLLDELIESGPDDLVAHLSYSAVLARHKKYEDAITVLSRKVARVKDPKRYHWNLFYRLGIAYERTKQWPLAEKAFQKSLELFPDQPSVLNYLGYSWVDMNINLQQGLDMIRKAVELRPNDGYMVDSLGWAYYRLNRIMEAVVKLEQAVDLRPGDPTINDHLGDAYWRANRRLEAVFQWRHALALDPPEADIARIEEKLDVGLDVVLEREAKEAAEAKKSADQDDKG